MTEDAEGNWAILFFYVLHDKHKLQTVKLILRMNSTVVRIFSRVGPSKLKVFVKTYLAARSLNLEVTGHTQREKQASSQRCRPKSVTSRRFPKHASCKT